MYAFVFSYIQPMKLSLQREREHALLKELNSSSVLEWNNAQFKFLEISLGIT